MTQENTILAASETVSLFVVYTFEEYIAWRRRHLYQGDTVMPIEWERKSFHESLPLLATRHRFTIAVWHRYYEGFIRSQDAADLQDTLGDALS